MGFGHDIESGLRSGRPELKREKFPEGDRRQKVDLYNIKRKSEDKGEIAFGEDRKSIPARKAAEVFRVFV